MKGFCRSIMLSCALLGLACDESLPPRIDPPPPLQGGLTSAYLLYPYKNVVGVKIVVTNSSEFVLSDTAVIHGYATITSVRRPDLYVVIPLNDSVAVGTGADYDYRTKELTMTPGSKLSYTFDWNFKTSSGVDLRTALFRYDIDTGCTVRRIAKPELFRLTGYYEIYRRTAMAALGPYEFTICHVDTFVGTRQCFDPMLFYPCP